MSNYKAIYDRARKNGTAKQRTAKYVKWEQKGQIIVGAYVSSAPVASRLGGTEYNQYLFDTDEGLVKFALGKSADNEIGEILTRGLVYAITFEGQEDIAGGRRVNKFDVVELPEIMEGVDDKDKAASDGKPVNKK